MTQYRNVYKYHLKRGNEIIHIGITNDLERRESEHKQNYGDSVKIHQVGHRTTKKAALEWDKRTA